jgi:ribosome maturation protein SDO1
MSTKYTLARLTIEGEHFEILVKPDPALQYKRGEQTSISQILVIDTIFTDSNKGQRASEQKLVDAFGTINTMEVAQQILRRGELQLTTDQRRRLIEEKRIQIIDYISRHSLDPRTGIPHPPTRIKQAMEQVRVIIDPFTAVEAQAKEVIGKLRVILPISVEQIRVAIKIPPEYVPVSMGVVKNLGEVKQEEWQSDGSWVAIVELTAGTHIPFLERLAKVTRGNLLSKILK